MHADRRVSLDAAFLAALKAERSARRGADKPAAPSITKGAVERALGGLAGDQGERVDVVARFLDGTDATALTPAARAALLAFVQAQQGSAGGTSVTDAPVATSQVGRSGSARARVLHLLAQHSSVDQTKQRSARVTGWLDVAEADLLRAGARLAGLAHEATSAFSGGVATTGADELATLIDGATKHRVQRGDVEEVRRWLATPPLPPARVDELRRCFERLDRAGTLSWTPGSVAELQPGTRFARVELARERHGDGFSFTAWIPLGARGRSGGAARDIGEFYVERTGGFAGLTLSVGPLQLGS
ncbi:MAG: hypothetical protein IT383_21170 [Deltaproteobacteria bacterium]|nr:hypothetical protein [Deltaproteobacteria bacterium]